MAFPFNSGINVARGNLVVASGYQTIADKFLGLLGSTGDGQNRGNYLNVANFRSASAVSAIRIATGIAFNRTGSSAAAVNATIRVHGLCYSTNTYLDTTITFYILNNGASPNTYTGLHYHNNGTQAISAVKMDETTGKMDLFIEFPAAITTVHYWCDVEINWSSQTNSTILDSANWSFQINPTVPGSPLGTATYNSLNNGLPTGTTNQTLRHNGSAWVATSGLLSTGTKVTVAGNNNDAHASGAALSVGGAYMVIGDEDGARTFTNGIGIKFYDAGGTHFTQKYDTSAVEMQWGRSSSVDHLQFDTNALTMRLGYQKVSIGAPAPATSGQTVLLRVDGTMIIGSVVGTPTTLVGRDGTGQIGTMAVSSKLGISAGTLDVTEANLTLSNMGGVVPISKGGTNLSALGTFYQQLRVNAAGTALEYFSAPITYQATRTAPTVVDNYVEIGAVTKTNGVANYDLRVTMQGSGVSVSKTYRVSTFFSATGSVYQLLMPISSSGVYSGQNFEVEMNGASGVDTLRIRRTAGTTAATIYVSLTIDPTEVTSFAASSGTGTSAITATYSLGSLAQVANRVGINTIAPAQALHVVGNIRVSSVTGTPTSVIGRDANGDIGGLTLTNSTIAISSGNLRLVNDANAPGNWYFYGTNGSGTKGYALISSAPITESQITDSTILARVASSETITGSWTFTTGTFDFQGAITRLKDSTTYIYDEADTTKSLRFQVSGVTTGTTRNLTVQDKDGTIAVESWKTINAPADSGFTWGSADVVATTATDTLKIVAGANITIATDSASKAIRITASGGVSGGTTDRIAIWNGSTSITTDNLFWDFTNDRLGIGSGASTPLTTLHVAGISAFGDSVTATNAIRALNLNSTTAVMRILRISADIATAAPGVELMHRTTSDGTNTQYWDTHLKSTGFWIRDRTSGDLDRFHISTAGDVGIGVTANSAYKLLANGAIRATGAIQAYGVGNTFTGDLASPHVRMTNTTASTGDTWVIGSRNDGGLDIQCGNLSQVARFNATTGRFDLSYAFGLSGFANSASLGASQNNYDIADAGAAAVHRLTASTPINITGMVGGVAGRIVILTNIGTNTITLINESASSTAGNRFTLNADLAITAKSSVILWYDGTTSRWIPAGGAGGGGSTDAPVDAQYLTLATNATLTNERVFTAGANVVVTDGGAGSTYTVAVGTQTFGLTGIISPTGTTGTVNDYNPTSLSTAAIIRQTTSGATSITGLSGGASGRMILFFNIGTHDIEFLNESASSTAANRFAMGTDFKLAPNKSIHLWYDSTSSRWRAVGVEDDSSTRLNLVAKTAGHTLVIGDAGKFITMDSTSNITLTIPTNASVAFPIGTVVTIARTNTGKVNVAGSGGVTVNSADGDLYLRSRYSSATMMKTATDTWLVVGDLTAT